MAQEIGSAKAIQGQMTAVGPEGARTLSVGSPVFKGDTLATAKGSAGSIQFLDKTVLNVGEGSKVSLDQYVYDSAKGSGQALFKMAQGTFRAVTGEIVKQNPESFKMQSPLATIGIRGTETAHTVPEPGQKDGSESHLVMVFDGKPVIVQPIGGGAYQVLSQAGVKVEVGKFGAGPVMVMSPQEYKYFQALTTTGVQQGVTKDTVTPVSQGQKDPKVQAAQDAANKATAEAQAKAVAAAAAKAAAEAAAKAAAEAAASDDPAAKAAADAAAKAAAEAASKAAADAKAAAEAAAKAQTEAFAAQQAIAMAEAAKAAAEAAAKDALDAANQGTTMSLTPGSIISFSTGTDSFGRTITIIKVTGPGGETQTGQVPGPPISTLPPEQPKPIDTTPENQPPPPTEPPATPANTLLDLSGEGQAMSVNLVSHILKPLGSNDGTDIASTVVNVIGSNYGDDIIGSTSAETLSGGDGDDSISGGGGLDNLSGGNGNDVLTSGGAQGVIFNPGTGQDTVIGGQGGEAIFMGTALNNDDGQDSIDGGMGVDYLYFTDNGNSTGDLRTTKGVEQVILGDATTNITFPNHGIFNSTEWADIGGTFTLNGSAVGTSAPETTTLTFNGSQALYGKYFITGGNGTDTIYGGNGDDTIVGGKGADSIDGGSGNDLLKGEADNDTLIGGNGDDILAGGAGNDSLVGGSDNNTADYSGSTGGILVTMGNGMANDGMGGVDVLFDIQNIDGSSFADEISGNTVANVLTGGDGADLISGGFGNDSLEGNDGNDSIDGGGDNDTIAGGAGNDSIDGGGDNDTIAGGAGNDSIDGGDGTDTITGGAGNDLLSGGGNDTTVGSGDTLSYQDESGTAQGGGVIATYGASLIVTDTYGTNDMVSNFEHIIGTDKADTIYINSDQAIANVQGINLDGGNTPTGVDKIVFNADADMTKNAANGEMHISGLDKVELNASTTDRYAIFHSADATGESWNVDKTGAEHAELAFTMGSASTFDASGFSFGSGWNQSTDTIRILGGVQDDTITGTDARDSIIGGQGDDSITAGGGNDYLGGADGNDTILGGEGDNTIAGGLGADSITAGAGNDLLDGGEGNDTITAGDGANTLIGGLGADTLTGGSGIDTVDYSQGGGSGTISIYYDGGWFVGDTNGNQDLLSGIEKIILNDANYSAGFALDSKLADDMLTGITGSATSSFTVDGSNLTGINALKVDGSDVTSAFNLKLIGGAGNDTLGGGGGTDTVDGGAGSDTAFYAQCGDDLNIELVNGWATVTATSIGSDTLVNIENLISGSGNDTLTGDQHNNFLFGGDGNNSLTGNAGDDTLTGGIGNDVLAGGDGMDTANFGACTDNLSITLVNGADTVIAASTGTDTLTSIENLIGGSGNDSLTGDSSNNDLFGGQGDDTLTGEIGNDTLEGGLGNDFLHGGGGSDTVDYSEAAAGLSIALDNGGNATVDAGDLGMDTLTGIENLIGGQWNDTLTGGGGDNALFGGSGSDSLFGGSGTDSLTGGAGDDALFGGAGADNLTGGDGADIFAYRDMADFGDQITGYTSSTDLFNFSSNLGWGDQGILRSSVFDSLASVNIASTCLYTEGGNLYYDSDGTGNNGAVVVAQGVDTINAAQVTLTQV